MITFAHVIRASAGSGKTTRLAAWFIERVSRGERPDRILATTFTKKAAGEIKERIFQRLLQEAAGVPGHGATALEATVASKVLLQIVSHQHRLGITTLDGFFHRIAQVFAIEIGLRPGWRIADPFAAEKLLEDALAELLEGPESEALLAFLGRVDRGRSGRSIYARILSEVRVYHRLLRDAAPAAWGWLDGGSSRPWSTDEVERLFVSAQQAIMYLPLPRTAKGNAENGHWIKAREALVRALASVPSSWKAWEALLGGGLLRALITGGTFQRVEFPEAFRQALTPIIDAGREFFLRTLDTELRETERVMRQFDRLYCRVQERSGILTFDDVRARLVASMRSRDLSEIFYRLDSSVQHLLVDEFQDTSRDQWELLRPMASEILAQPGEGRTFLAVGDVKQAIYGWRGGVAEIFDSLVTEWPHLSIEAVNTSYRCAPAVIECVNTIFASLASNPALGEIVPIAQSWQERFHLHQSGASREEGVVTLHEVRTEDEQATPLVDMDFEGGESGLDRAVLHRIVTTVRAALSRRPSDSIGVLVRRNEVVSQVRRALLRAGLPSSEEGGTPLGDAPSVQAVISLLRGIDHPEHSLAWFHVRAALLDRHPWVRGCVESSSSSHAIRDLRRRILHEGLGSVLGEILFGGDEPYFQRWSGRDARRLEQLVSAAYEFEEHHGVSYRLEPFIRLSRQLRAEDSSGERVRVMTIHQSKGLEFDVVVLPELDERLLKTSLNTPLVWRAHPLAPPERISRPVSETVRLLDPRFQEMAVQAEAMRLREALSVLYVAITRARRRLEFIIEGGGEAGENATTSRVSRSRLTFAAILRGAYGTREQVSGAPEGCSRLHGVAEEQGLADSPPGLAAECSSADERSTGTLAELLGSQMSQHAARTPSRRGPIHEADAGGFREFAARREARLLGDEVHGFLSGVEWYADDGSIVYASPETARRLSPRAQALRERLESNSAFRALLSTQRLLAEWKEFGVETVRSLREVPIRVQSGGDLYSGIVDRIVIGERQGIACCAEVIDFKLSFGADSVFSGEEKESLPGSTVLNSYRMQVETYCAMVSELLGIPSNKVTGMLVNLSEPEASIRVCPNPLSPLIP